jgi:hypothetical protein
MKVRGGRACHKKGPKCKKLATRVTFRSDEPGKFKLTFKRAGGHSPKPVQKALVAGSNVVTLSTKRVPPGRYSLSLVATDVHGTATPPIGASLRVR